MLRSDNSTHKNSWPAFSTQICVFWDQSPIYLAGWIFRISKGDLMVGTSRKLILRVNAWRLTQWFVDCANWAMIVFKDLCALLFVAARFLNVSFFCLTPILSGKTFFDLTTFSVLEVRFLSFCAWNLEKVCFDELASLWTEFVLKLCTNNFFSHKSLPKTFCQDFIFSFALLIHNTDFEKDTNTDSWKETCGWCVSHE